MVRSKSALVAPITTAIAMPWMISGASSPSMCTPSTFCVALSTTSFIIVLRERPDSVWRIGVNSVR